MRNGKLVMFFSFCCIAVLMTSCNSEEHVVPQDAPLTRDEVAVGINCTTQTEVTRGGATGLLKSNTDLQNHGVGVFAYYTGSSTWASAGSSTAPNFMYNQYVEYLAVGLDASGNDVYSWVYSPTKYWPNDNTNADNVGATGSQTASYLSFFAYAPYVEVTPSTGVVADESTTGITALTSNSTAGAPKVTYTWTNDITQQVDLLWGTRSSSTSYDLASGSTDAGSSSKTVNTDLTKQTTGETVDFLFKHALSSVDIYVRRVYDEVSASGKSPDNDVDTKIFVSELVLTPASLYSVGQFDLSTGTWSGQTSAVTTPVTYDNTMIREAVRGTTSTDEVYIRDAELNKWSTKWDSSGNIDNESGTVPAGVTETSTLLHLSTIGLILIPQGTVTFTPKIKYSFVTKDNELQENYLTDKEGNRYTRITHEIEGSGVNMVFESGKRYTLLCLIGVESVSFEVTAVEDWDFPILLNPTVTAETETKPKTVDEQ